MCTTRSRIQTTRMTCWWGERSPVMTITLVRWEVWRTTEEARRRRAIYRATTRVRSRVETLQTLRATVMWCEHVGDSEQQERHIRQHNESAGVLLQSEELDDDRSDL